MVDFWNKWPSRDMVQLGAAVLLALQLAAFAFIVAGTHGWIVPLGAGPLPTTDFVSFYAAGALANAGTPALAYDHAAHLAAEEAVAGAGIGYQFFNYPPTYLLLCAVLAPLPYLVAFIVFETATLLLFLAVGLRVLGERSGVAIMVLLAFPLVFWNYGLGQNAFLTAGLFGLGTLLLDERPVASGIAFGLLCYKPQFGLLLPLALAAGGHWRVFAAAAATVVVMVLASVALFGAETWRAFLMTAGASPEMYASGRILFAGMANTFGAVRLLGGSVTAGYAAQVAASLVAAGIVVTVWRARLSLSTRAGALLAAVLVAAPLALLYDLMLGAMAGCWLLRDRTSPAAAPWGRAALTVIYLVLLDGRGLSEKMHIPVFALAPIALLAIATVHARREMRGRAQTAGAG